MAFSKMFFKLFNKKIYPKKPAFNPDPTKPQDVFKLLKEAKAHTFTSRADCEFMGVPGNRVKYRAHFRHSKAVVFYKGAKHKTTCGDDHNCFLTLSAGSGAGTTYITQCGHSPEN